ncbi:Bromodomain family protein [Babesia bovis T2Bo]|uniref:Bromodomain family protein n=1 Tax=Babesia bovis T2Bo TaxID=484906 RepID=UPI001C36736F|nr:Bromodomain family protein [Babesia bovis T2Bo]EDO06696.2 Bromodomain family protein [Babesia bovis T2Bo]
MEDGKTWRHFCTHQILKKMRADRYGALFANPVLESDDSIITPEVKNAYRAIIENPMDYKTVKSKLQSDIYQSPLEFHDDMLLIYDNCMKFNPAVGVNKWIHDAAASNKSKFEKLWSSSQDKINSLLAKPKTEDKDHVDNDTLESGNENNIPEVVPSQSQSGSQPADSSLLEKPEADTQSQLPNNTNPETLETASSVLDSHIESPTQSQVDADMDSSPSAPGSTVDSTFKVKFRLSLQSIKDYREYRVDTMSKVVILPHHLINEPPPPDVLDPTIVLQSPVLSETVSDAIPSARIEAVSTPQKECSTTAALVDEQPVSMEITIPETTKEVVYTDLPESEETDVDFGERPPIATRQEDGFLRSNWLTENECNQLFPHCSIIGLQPRKYKYTRADATLRTIYNELFLSDHSEPKPYSNDDLLESIVEEDYTLKHHKAVHFSVKKPSKESRRLLKQLPEFGDYGSTSQCDEESWLPSPYYQETVHDSCESLVSSYSEEVEDSPGARFHTLRIDVESEATFGVSIITEQALCENGFTKVPKCNYFIRCTPEVGFRSSNYGFYKAEEDVFMHGTSILRHLRLYLINCGATCIELSRRMVSFADLIYQHGTSSAIYELYLKSKSTNLKHPEFFVLTDAGAISYATCVDVLWRLQTVTSALPKPFVILHVLCRNMS